MNSRIRMLFNLDHQHPPLVTTAIFRDWFDFADWLQQESFANRTTCILGWEYIQKEPEEQE